MKPPEKTKRLLLFDEFAPFQYYSGFRTSNLSASVQNLNFR